MQAGGAAACETLNVVPATVAVPIRLLVVVFAAIEYVTDPDPVRPLPFWKVRKLLVLVALQAQPACVVTSIRPVATP